MLQLPLSFLIEDEDSPIPPIKDRKEGHCVHCPAEVDLVFFVGEEGSLVLHQGAMCESFYEQGENNRQRSISFGDQTGNLITYRDLLLHNLLPSSDDLLSIIGSDDDDL